jgi:hypothetical protein
MGQITLHMASSSHAIVKMSGRFQGWARDRPVCAQKHAAKYPAQKARSDETGKYAEFSIICAFLEVFATTPVDLFWGSDL